MTKTRSRTRQIPFLALLLLVAVAARCQTNENAPDAPADDATDDHVAWALSYVNQEYGFEFKLPADWKGFRVVQTSGLGTRGRRGRFCAFDIPITQIRIPVRTFRSWSSSARNGNE